MAKDVSIIVRAVDKFTAPVQEMNSRLKGFADGIKNVAAGIGAYAIGSALERFLKGTVTEALEAQKSVARLDAALNTMGLSYDQVRPQVEKYLTTLQKTTRYSDEDGREALTKLVAMTGNYQQSLKDMQVVVDLAAFKQINLSEAAVIVAKAHQGVGRELKAFNLDVKAGADMVPQLTARLKDYEKGSRSMGDRLQTVNNLWAEFREKIGAALIGGDKLSGGVTRLQRALIDLTAWVEENSDKIGGWVGTVVDGAALVGKAFGAVVGALTGHTGAIDAAIDAQKKKIREEGDAFEEVRARVNAIYIKKQEDANAATKNAADAAEIAADKKKKAEEEALKANKDAAKKHREEQLQAQKAFVKAVEEVEKYSGDTVRSLLEGHYKAYADASATFWEKITTLQKNAVAANKIGSQEYEGALRSLGAAQDAITRKFADAALALKQLDNTYATLPPSLTRVALGQGLVTEKQLQHIAASNNLRLQIKGVVADTTAWVEKALELADALGISDDAMRQSVDSIIQIGNGLTGLVDAFHAVKTAVTALEKASVILAAISAALSIIRGIGSLFGGKSAAEKALEAALDKNRVSLERLRDTVGDLNINLTGKQLSGTQGALKEFFATGGAAKKGWGDRLGQLLLSRGVNMDDLEAVAKTLNIDIKPGGKLSPQALKQLQEAIGLVEPTQFRNDFKGQKEALGYETTLLNLTPEQQAQRLAALAGGSLGSGKIGAALGGLDFTSGTGRASGLAAIQQLFRDLPSFRAADLGGLTGTEFLRVLEEIKSLLDTANQNAANAAGGTVTGLPGDTGTPLTPNLPADVVPGGSGVPTPTLALPLFEFGGVSRDLFRQIADHTREMADLMSGRIRSTVAAAGSSVLNDARISLTIEQIIVQASPGVNGTQVGTDIARSIDEEFGRLRQLAQKATGSVVRV